MTILSVKLHRRGQWQKEEDGHQSVVDVWQVVSDSDTETITAILAAPGLPSQGDDHPEKAEAKCKTLDCDHDSSVFRVWYLNANYSTKMATRENKPHDEQRVKGGMRSGFREVPAFCDSLGRPLVNSAGDLYEGLTRKSRTLVIPVTANFTTIPAFLFRLAESLNANDVTIHGETYPPLSCYLSEVQMPDEPERDTEGNMFWPVTYSVTIDPSGWHILLPNKGLNELVFQRKVTINPVLTTGLLFRWEDCTKAQYTAVPAAADKQIIKRKIQTTEQQEIPNEIWLNADGQAQRVITFQNTQFGTASITANSKTLTSVATFGTDGKYNGAMIRLQGAGLRGRWHSTKIVTATGNTATLADAAITTVAGTQLWISGAIVNSFLLENVEDWTGVPLPNNAPGQT